MKQEKQTILEWYQKNHKYIDAACNGKGNCGRCKIKFLTNPPSASRKDLKLLTFEELKSGIRLACTTEKTKREDFVPIGDFLQRDIFVPELKKEEIFEEREIFDCYEITEKTGTVQETEYGIALDIGTTTLAMSLIGLTSKCRFFTVTQVNHQRSFGSDVISRIQAANEGHLEELQALIRRDLLELLEVLIEKSQIKPEQLMKITVVGNTVMLHLLQGLSCEGLGRAPFHPAVTALVKIGVNELFFGFCGTEKQNDLLRKLNPEITILPVISAFIGADITAGIYACDFDLKSEYQMLTDVGTNGEMVIGNCDGFLAASVAAGPVFEAGNISCGIPACSGAVSHIECCKEENGKAEWKYEILGAEGTKARGLCGSGLPDLVSELLRLGEIDENGVLKDAYFETGFLVPIKENETEKPFFLTQSDIRELQMGKAAIRAGMELLLQRRKPKKIYLSGGFGTALDKNSAAGIGLFPKAYLDAIVPAGNTALFGAEKYLLDEKGEERVVHIAQMAEELPLANDTDFQEKYIHFMQFLV